MEISEIQKLLEEKGCIAAIWSVEDVKQERPDLTEAQCMEVLKLCEEEHDAELGINWCIIRSHAEDLFPQAEDGYFIGKSGKRYGYKELGERVRNEIPLTLGKHISIQLEVLGLSEEMAGGVTPFSLPYTFAEEPKQRQLTSSNMVHTPGFFRAMQNDYHVKGSTRQRAIKILCDVYKLPRKEAEGILSGSIPVEIDESAGTVSYIVP